MLMYGTPVKTSTVTWDYMWLVMGGGGYDNQTINFSEDRERNQKTQNKLDHHEG